MKTIIFSISFLLILFNVSSSNPKICFKENKGQVSDQNYKKRLDALFSVDLGNMNCFFTKNSVSYQLSRIDTWKKDSPFRSTQVINKSSKYIPEEITLYRVDIKWLNANSNAFVHGLKPVEGYDNYYLASCPTGATHVKSYYEVLYEDVYPGINLHYYEKEGTLKYDYIVQPHSNYKSIQLSIQGATSITIKENGELCLSTPLGDIIEGKPVFFQNNKTINGSWKVFGNIVSFDIPEADPNYELIIDPPLLARLWGTFYGGSNYEEVMNGALDNSGNSFVCGYTDTPTSTLIYTTGAYQTVFNGGNRDGFVVKFSPSGNRLWGTYLGDADMDAVLDCYNDVSGNLYVTGQINLSSALGNVISTPGSHQPTSGGGNSDAFLIKFDPNGVRVWGTYYGCPNGEMGYSCVVDSNGDVCMGGGSIGFPSVSPGTVIATPGSFQPVQSDPFSESFIVKFNPFGVRLWGTYYGGTGNEMLHDIAVDPSDNLVLVGVTTSTAPNNCIATVGSHQPNYVSGSDVFVAKFSSAGSRLWGTYYGGTVYDEPFAVTTDPLGNIFFCGYTWSSSGIATPGAFQTVTTGNYDGFVVKLSANGARQWGTYYGDPNGNIGNYQGGISADINGNIYFVSTISITGPSMSNFGTAFSTPGTFKDTAYVGYDGFIVKFNGTSGARIWGTYYGGYNSSEFFIWCGVNNMGDLYTIGSSSGPSLINEVSTPGAYQTSNTGSLQDAFIVKFADPTFSPLGVTSIENPEEIQIYPNPADGSFQLLVPNNNEGIEVKIYDAIGRNVYHAKLTASNKNVINISEFPVGLYIVDVISHSENHRQKLIKY
jgi:hypothetical protein